MFDIRRNRRRAVVSLSLVAVLGVATGCSSVTAGPSAGRGVTDSTQNQSAGTGNDTGSSSGTTASVPVKVTSSANAKAGPIAVDQPVDLRATGGTLTEVKVTSKAGALAGEISEDGTDWQATGRLTPGTTYRVHATAEATDGTQKVVNSTFRTTPLSLDELTYPSIAPLQDETVGVGMPVIVSFDIPVTDRAAIEKHLSVSSTPVQKGAWHWMSDTEVHWRPAKYWKPGTDVTVEADIKSVNAGGGIYGQESRTIDFHVGDSVISHVNAQTNQMKTFINGKLARTTPITTGKAGFTTRSGVKVIMEKYRTKVMNSETVGIGQDNPEYYNISDVEYALRVTSSGEFLHAAPWSVSSQGFANVSHGCTGMSTENAKWMYDHSKRGDVVEYTGTDRPMTLTNGFGDWNLPFKDYAAGSALT